MDYAVNTYDLYRDIQQRTGGEIYIGVLGPVRTGKSTFIKRFMEEMVLPFMEDEPAKVRRRMNCPRAPEERRLPQRSLNLFQMRQPELCSKRTFLFLSG